MDKEINPLDKSSWQPLTEEKILSAPIEDIGEPLEIGDNPSFAIDSDGVAWMCGFFNGKFCRVRAVLEAPDVDSF